ncbi:hypothetical protein PAN31117_01448 [Pandoraea anapnoica]|uniref:Uncharacterized protein n=1 Tax=Pandoraea anapnoica TaxID=2508301 RepID=A0A5E4ZSL5_9BURK|nr:hypothetical protein PAN31117_01448 [Pandoraea anapnoica]
MESGLIAKKFYNHQLYPRHARSTEAAYGPTSCRRCVTCVRSLLQGHRTSSLPGVQVKYRFGVCTDRGGDLA